MTQSTLSPETCLAPPSRVATIAAVRAPARDTGRYPGAPHGASARHGDDPAVDPAGELAGEAAVPDGERVEDVLAHIRVLWADEVLREAILLASPDLARAAEAADAGRPISAKKAAALHRGLLKYAIRATTRPTPFGLFGGVAAATFGPRPITVDDTAHRKSVRIGQPVLKRIRREVEQNPWGLRVVVNPVATAGHGRLYLPFREGETDGNDDRVDVRLTPALEHVLGAAATLVPAAELRDRLLDAFPGAQPEMVEGYLVDLVRTGVLLTELAPSAFDADPAVRLAAVGDRLGDVPELTQAYGLTRPGAGRRELAHLLDRLDAIDDSGLQRGVQVDLHLRCHGDLPPAVEQVAPDVVDALCRVSVMAPSSPYLATHADRFVERYGDTEVPLLSALDPVIGIGMPAGYPTSPYREGPPRPVESAELSALFAGLIETARRTGATSVVLDPDTVAVLPLTGRPPASVDLFLELSGDPDAPEVALGATGVAMPAGRSFGRFAGADPTLRQHLVDCARHDEDAHPDDLIVELDYLTSNSSANNVALSPSAYRHRLVVTGTPEHPTPRPGGVTPDGSDTSSVFSTSATSLAGQHRGTPLTVHNLLLGVHEGRFYLRDAVSRRTVLTRRLNLVTSTISTDLVRFLEEVSDDGIIRPSWTWGSLEGRLDFLPEVRYRGVVLSTAKWRVPARVRSVPDLRAWLHERDIPRYVYGGVSDNRLILDTADGHHLDLLLREVIAGAVYVAAAPAPDRLGLARDGVGRRRFATEVVVSVLATTSDAAPPVPLRATYDVDADRVVPPGQGWWHFDVYCEPSQQAAVMCALRDSADLRSGAMFFVRYHDGRSHLRIRARSEGVDPAIICAVLDDLRRARYLSSYRIRPYERELERYGGVEVIEHCETLFCAESALLTRFPDLCLPGKVAASGNLSTAHLGRGLALVEAWLADSGLGDAAARQILGLGAEGYRREFTERQVALRREVRDLRPEDLPQDRAQAVRDALHGRVASCLAAHAAAATPVEHAAFVLSLLHMWCNRLGFSRDREYQIIVAALRRIEARVHRAARREGAQR